jgi:hypothetical protein
MSMGAEALAAPAREPIWRSSTLHSALVSMVCHLLGLIVLGMLTFAAQHHDSGVALFSQFVSSDEPGAEVSILTATTPSESSSSTAAGPDMLFETDAFAVAELAGPQVELPPSPIASGLSGEGIGDAGEGSGLTGQGTGSGQFFGIVGTGRTFVYVLDCSESMLNNGRFDRARKELIESINRLSPDQRFYVVLYNDNAVPMDADDPVAAETAEIQKFREWIESVIPYGGTNPLPALEYALSQTPDAIYFLSDGEFEPIVIAAIREKNRKTRYNPRTIPIHTIAFASQAGENQMKILARSSGGKYRFVK